MKLLLDESLPKDLRLHLLAHEGITVPQRGWAAKQNGWHLDRLRWPEREKRTDGSTPRAPLGKVWMTLSPPVPSLSPAGVAATAAAPVQLGGGWALRDRR